MLEEARELMIKFIERYGFNDEITIASSVLVDKILNKEREKKCTGKLSIKNPQHPNYQAITRGSDEKKE